MYTQVIRYIYFFIGIPFAWVTISLYYAKLTSITKNLLSPIIENHAWKQWKELSTNVLGLAQNKSTLFWTRMLIHLDGLRMAFQDLKVGSFTYIVYKYQVLFTFLLFNYNFVYFFAQALIIVVLAPTESMVEILLKLTIALAFIQVWFIFLESVICLPNRANIHFSQW